MGAPRSGSGWFNRRPKPSYSAAEKRLGELPIIIVANKCDLAAGHGPARDSMHDYGIESVDVVRLLRGRRERVASDAVPCAVISARQLAVQPIVGVLRVGVQTSRGERGGYSASQCVAQARRRTTVRHPWRRDGGVTVHTHTAHRPRAWRRSCEHASVGIVELSIRRHHVVAAKGKLTGGFRFVHTHITHLHYSTTRRTGAQHITRGFRSRRLLRSICGPAC